MKKKIILFSIVILVFSYGFFIENNNSENCRKKFVKESIADFNILQYSSNLIPLRVEYYGNKKNVFIDLNSSYEELQRNMGINNINRFTRILEKSILNDISIQVDSTFFYSHVWQIPDINIFIDSIMNYNQQYLFDKYFSNFAINNDALYFDSTTYILYKLYNENYFIKIDDEIRISKFECNQSNNSQ